MLKQLRKYKNIIISFIIIILFLIFVKEKGFKKLTERFENTNLVDVLNGLDVQDQKLNDMVSKIDANTVTFNKNITVKDITVKDINSDKISIRQNGSLCIGETCITEEHLKILTGKKPFFIESSRGGIISDRGEGKINFQLNKGGWEEMYINRKI